MKTFKTFLAEASMVSNLDVRKFGLDELIACYENAGYMVPKSERKYFIDCAYVGYTKDHQHKFVVMMEDDGNDDGSFYISNFFVELGKDGNLVAESGGSPVFSGDEEEVQAKFDSLSK